MSLEDLYPSKKKHDDEHFEPFPHSNSNSPTHEEKKNQIEPGPVESLLTSITVEEEEQLRRLDRSADEIEEQAAHLSLQVKNMERKILELRGDNRMLQRGGGRNFVAIFDRYEERISRLENELRSAREDKDEPRSSKNNRTRKSEVSHLRDLTTRQKQEIGSLHERLSKWEKRGRQHQIRARMLRDALDKLTKSRQRTTSLRSKLAHCQRTIRENEHRVGRSNVSEVNLQRRVHALEDERKGMFEEIKMLREQLHEDSERVYTSKVCKHFGLRRQQHRHNGSSEDESNSRRDWSLTLRKTLRKLEKVLRLHRPRALPVLTNLLDEIHKLHVVRDEALAMEQEAVDILVDVVKDGGGLENVHRLMTLHSKRSGLMGSRR